MNLDLSMERAERLSAASEDELEAAVIAILLPGTDGGDECAVYEVCESDGASGAGCFNPATHAPAGGTEWDTAPFAAQLRAKPNGIEGVSFSGREPLQQPEALLDSLERLAGSGLSMLVFSGYTVKEIQQLPLGPRIVARLDVLIAGRYVESRHVGRGLLGSGNQRIHFLTSRYRPADFQSIPVREVIVHADGSVTLSGIADRAQSNL